VILNILSLCLVLPGINASAENIPYTEEEINSIGANNFKMLNAIGLHTFNFSDSGNKLESIGYLYLANTYDYSVKVFLTPTIKLSVVDVDDEGNPRTHTVTENIIYYPYPKISYIQLEETEFTINPQSKYKISYKLVMPAKETYESINEDINNGFLGYINIRTESEGVINVNYNYKVFSAFEGVYQEPILVFTGYSIILLLISLILLSIVLVKKYIINRKEGIKLEAE